MVTRRAIEAADRAELSGPLPPLYKALTPLSVERHGTLGLAAERDHGFAAQANAVPLVVDEFPQAMRHYPIVFAGGEIPTPVALVGHTAHHNDYVDAEGNWRSGAYVPAYVRRYPFMLLRESETSGRELLCADLSSILFVPRPSEDERLFTDGSPSARLNGVLDFCKRYEVSQKRTRAVMEEVASLRLISPASVEVERGGGKMRVQGFSTIAEARVRDLADDRLAGLARRGVLTLFAAHYMSLANFSDIGAG